MADPHGDETAKRGQRLRQWADSPEPERLQPEPFPDEGGSPGAPGSPYLLQPAARAAIERMNEMNFLQTQRARPQQVAARLEASTAPGPGQRPGEGAHSLRRCAPFFESAHLGKPRRFLRRCARFYKMRTENCASSQNGAPRPSGRLRGSVSGGPLPDRELTVIPLVGCLRIRPPIGYPCQMRSTKWTSGAQA
jgi:hypothetical protein